MVILIHTLHEKSIQNLLTIKGNHGFAPPVDEFLYFMRQATTTSKS